MEKHTHTPGSGEELHSPADFITTHRSALLTPSHFTLTSTAPLTSTSVTPVCPTPSLPPRGADPWTLFSHTREEGGQHHQKNQTLNYTHTPLREEMEKMRRKVEKLTEDLRERDSIISRQCIEREELCAELKKSKSKRERKLHNAKAERHTGTGSDITQTPGGGSDIRERGAAEKAEDSEQLQREKDGLCLSVELLNVRVKSANDILILQERELEEQVSDLQKEVHKLQSHITFLEHNLEDKTAQLQLHNLHTQELQQQLCSVGEENERLKKDKERSEKSTTHITDSVHRLSVCAEEWESQIGAAQCRMSALTQRLNFANTRLHTVRGLLMRREALQKVQQATKPTESTSSDRCIESLQSQVALLSSERDTLTQELKRTPQLINNALRDLQLQLNRSREELAVCELQCVEANAQFLQEKLSEVESVCATQLREMESQLNTARREHTKAVVALCQVERTAVRERQQEREAERARSEHTHTHITQLQTQLKKKDRDHNILLAVVQQQGLMNEFKKMRRAALHTSTVLKDKQQHKQQQTGDTEQQEGRVLSVLSELHSLSSALIHSTDEEDEDEEQDKKTTH
ncbi:coiled-coil alpha-helical rod protein 1 isoform X2 [Silurus asotus]|uniref:Coiled-coil alpha-helical rod protein 1 n=1 Tax=Silurus asotus TaxID=30991 RepID=A0AAD5B8G6_SILAS|nr:coiled-coil alpha-helical rod protein 1 isoform X2 [Silurus asotus]